MIISAVPPIWTPPTGVAADWQWVIGPASGGHDKALTTAKSRKVTFRLAAPSDAAFSLDGRTEAAGAIDELATDLHLIRDRRLLDRMRIAPSSDDVNDDSHTVAVAALDYREVLNRRRLYLGDTLTWAATDQAEIAWQLISQTQARAGGQLGISKGVGNPTGMLRDRTYAPGDSIGEKVQELSDVIGGFDWAIVPRSASELALDIWPQRGAARGVVLEYGGLVAKVQRAVDPGAYANAITETGDSGAVPVVTPEVREASDLASRAEGRWDAVFGTDIQTQAALAERADWQLATAQVVQPTYTLTLKAGAWGGPDHIWLGDTVQVVVFSGRLQVDTMLRVYEINVVLDEDGNEAVAVTVGGPKPDYARRPAAMLRRLTNLERR